VSLEVDKCSTRVPWNRHAQRFLVYREVEIEWSETGFSTPSTSAVGWPVMSHTLSNPLQVADPQAGDARGLLDQMCSH